MGKVVKIRKRNRDDLDDVIDSFIENLDLKTIRQVMEMLDWKWLAQPPYDVPSIDMMKDSIRHYMKECARGAQEKLSAKPKKSKASYETGTGGFWYRAWVYRDDPKIYFDVKFALTDWNNFD